jgi:hypothetical protein
MDWRTLMHERLQRVSGAMLHARMDMSDWTERKREEKTHAHASVEHGTHDETG